MSSEVKLCMIGAGGHASWNIYPNFWLLKDARVVANADLDEAKAKRQASMHSIASSYTDYRKMIETEKPDGVIVCVGHEFNEKAVPELMEMGVHVYMEKPTSGTLAAARRMLEVSRRTGKICMTAYKKRFAPAYRKAKDTVEGDAFGKPVLMSILRTKGYKPGKSPADEEYMLRWGCHALDLFPYYFGPVKSVYTARTPGSTDGYAVSMTFDNGAVGTMSVTRCHGGAWEQLKLFGSNLRAVTVDNSINMVEYDRDQPVATHAPSFTQGAKRGSIEQGFAGELQEYADAIRDGRQPDANIESSAHTMALYEAIERSAKTGALTEVEAL